MWLEPLQSLDAGGDPAASISAYIRQKLTASPVAERALKLGLPCFKPESFKKQPEAVDTLRELAPELMVVVAYGLLLPDWALHSVPQGCLNIHASLLPRWRGAAPIQRAIEAGDSDTGVCIMQMDAGLDTGAVLMRESLPISDTDTSASLHDKLAALGAKGVLQTLAHCLS